MAFEGSIFTCPKCGKPFPAEKGRWGLIWNDWYRYGKCPSCGQHLELSSSGVRLTLSPRNSLIVGVIISIVLLIFVLLWVIWQNP